MTKEIISDVWKLETSTEETACDIVNNLYEQAISGSTGARNVIKKCFDDNWQTIKERFNAEGSVWYVWYMDGVREFIRNYYQK